MWKPRTYIIVFWHCSYSSLSVETSYIHTCFLALFICITKCGKPVYPYVFSGIVRIHHSVRKICICYNILFYVNRYSFLLQHIVFCYNILCGCSCMCLMTLLFVVFMCYVILLFVVFMCRVIVLFVIISVLILTTMRV